VRNRPGGPASPETQGPKTTTFSGRWPLPCVRPASGAAGHHAYTPCRRMRGRRRPPCAAAVDGDTRGFRTPSSRGASLDGAARRSGRGVQRGWIGVSMAWAHVRDGTHEPRIGPPSPAASYGPHSGRRTVGFGRESFLHGPKSQSRLFGQGPINPIPPPASRRPEWTSRPRRFPRESPRPRRCDGVGGRTRCSSSG
jgi:hypothetical protein